MKIGVVGLGLVGGSIAKKMLRQPGFSVFGFDVLPGTVALAKTEGITIMQPEEMAEACDLIVVATSATVALEEIEKLLLFGARAVVDVSSIKDPIVKGLTHLSCDLRGKFLATHPMAGAQRSGFANSREDLLDSCTWALSGAPSLDTFFSFCRLADVFDASLVPIEANTHDQAVARSSHLVQFLHSALAARLADEKSATLLLSGPALRDSTRLAESPYEGFWREVFYENNEAIIAARDELIEELKNLSGLEDVWRHGALGRERLLQFRWEEKRWREYSVPLASWWEDLLRLGGEGVAIKKPRKEEFLLLFQRSF